MSKISFIDLFGILLICLVVGSGIYGIHAVYRHSIDLNNLGL